MAMEHSPSRWSPLRLSVALDAAFEFIAGAALLAGAPTLGRWYDVSPVVPAVAGIAFVVAGFAIASLLLNAEPDRRLVRALAWANIGGGILGWVTLVVAWPQVEPAGRWLLGAAADSFIAIGLLELFALRVQRPSSSASSERQA